MVTNFSHGLHYFLYKVSCCKWKKKGTSTCEAVTLTWFTQWTMCVLQHCESYIQFDHEGGTWPWKSYTVQTGKSCPMSTKDIASKLLWTLMNTLIVKYLNTKIITLRQYYDFYKWSVLHLHWWKCYLGLASRLGHSTRSINCTKVTIIIQNRQ